MKSRTRHLAISCCLTALLTGCASGADGRATSAPGPSSLELRFEVTPNTGQAPLSVRLSAQLTGAITDPARFRCPSVAWVMGNGDVLITRAQDCREGVAPRRFESEYTYTAAGSYSPFARLLAVDVEPSRPQPLLVLGPTPTPAPVAAVPGPTVIVATPARIALGRATGTAAGAAAAPPAAASGSPSGAVTAGGMVGTVAAATVTSIAGPPLSPTAAGTLAGPVATAIARLGPSTPLPATAIAGIGVATPRGRAPAGAEPVGTATSAPPGPVASVATIVQVPVRPIGATPAGIASATPLGPTSTRTVAIVPSTATKLAATRTTAPTITPTSRPTQSATATAPPTTVRPIPSATPTPSRTASAVPSNTSSPTASAPRTQARGTARVLAAGTAAARNRVLPADLYYVSRSDGRIWRLPATGTAPEAVSPSGADVTEYEVSAGGNVAYVSGGRLWLIARGAEPLAVADGGSAPAWSRDGRRLAYAADGTWRYDLGSGRRTRLTTGGEPLAWSRDGQRLVVRRPEGGISIVHADTGASIALPIGDASEAGWLPDREVFWAAGNGLRLVGVEPQVLVTVLLPGSTPSASVFARPDGKLLSVLGSTDRRQPFAVDLQSDDLAVVPYGPGLDLGEAEAFAWSPDGRNGAVAGPSGIALLDAVTGADVPLVSTPARAPSWVLPPRS